MEYSHSIVLFSKEDGSPLEFNIQYVVEKNPLKSMIEHGGGSWTIIDCDDAIYLVSPGTKFINVGAEKKVLSSRYVFDCVKQDFLLNMNDYKIEITEVETSDFSEDNSLKLTGNEPRYHRKSSDGSDNSVDIIDTNKTVSPHLLDYPSSNHAFDFQDSEYRNETDSHKNVSDLANPVVPTGTVVYRDVLNNYENQLQNSKNPDRSTTSENENYVANKSINAHSENINFSSPAAQEPDLDTSEEVQAALNEQPDKHSVEANNSLRDSPVNAVIVSSSQPNIDGFSIDPFDNMILNKLQEKPVEQNDEPLSQSYTVSSSADAQVPSKPSPHDTSGDIFVESAAAPDSASQTTEIQQYIKNLEKEVEQILLKPSPKTIEDKTVLVKYICCAKKLPPATVLHTLQNYH